MHPSDLESESQQIELLVAPLMVIAGWCISIPMSLEYTIFESCALVFSLIMINLLLCSRLGRLIISREFC